MQFTYRGLAAQLNRHTVTDEEIDRQLQRLLQQNFRTAPVKDRPTCLGDEIVLDYAGFCEGEQFDGGTAKIRLWCWAAVLSFPVSKNSWWIRYLKSR